ncbi:hypothetical protein V3C99_015625 [Haemonchus contortus]|uniref:Zinc finger protein n=1 Tax=Haemonchus contortus TaxID=6289 RepID=A0A7I4YYA3_HAECO
MVLCAICGKASLSAFARRTSSVLNQNVILLVSLSLAGRIDIQEARRLFESATKRLEFVCHQHLAQAAQFLLTEMAAVGKTFEELEDPSTPSGRTAYVTDMDIPLDLVNSLNRLAGGATVVSCRDVSKFINENLKRYYSTSVWPEMEEVRIGRGSSIVKNVEEGGVPSVSERPCSITSNENSVSGADEENPASSILEETTDVYVTDVESESCFSTTSSVEDTDPRALSQYFLVKGNVLMKLFKFCPRCGSKLNGAHLEAAGTAAVVKFNCKQCSSTEMNWTSERSIDS